MTKLPVKQLLNGQAWSSQSVEGASAADQGPAPVDRFEYRIPVGSSKVRKMG